MSDPIYVRNLAETLADVLPKATLVQQADTGVPGLTIAQVAVPKSHELKEVRVDLEKFMAAPRATKATAQFATAESFLAYIHRHADDRSVVWCEFDPQTFRLSFTAVLDEHAKAAPAWRTHTAKFSPEHSAEWRARRQVDAADRLRAVDPEP